ncbi:hypothetical protein L596_029919 [Steinernema carpocapsae]|uniref:Uncharacterized protein n=1 Tax=Steinernema carpocapsae TaxID=34508 RepID=A0A4U5LR71_STECR|nr:hypothetical protein L596_029919 [Steinernema carpocapsae]
MKLQVFSLFSIGFLFSSALGGFFGDDKDLSELCDTFCWPGTHCYKDQCVPNMPLPDLRRLSKDSFCFEELCYSN